MAVAVMKEQGMSERRACWLLELCRPTMQYRRRVKPDEPVLRARLRELAMQRGGFGSPRLTLFLRREFPGTNHKRVERLYALERLQVQFRRRKRRKCAPAPKPLAVPTRPLERWSMDFVSDAFASGHRFRVLTILDEFDRTSPWLEPGTTLTGKHVADVLEELRDSVGLPRAIVVDNGTEFTSRAMLAWALERGVQLHFNRAGQTNAERVHRVLQRSAQSRMPQHKLVRRHRRSTSEARRLARGLQHRPTPRPARQSDTRGLSPPGPGGGYTDSQPPRSLTRCSTRDGEPS